MTLALGAAALLSAASLSCSDPWGDASWSPVPQRAIGEGGGRSVTPGDGAASAEIDASALFAWLPKAPRSSPQAAMRIERDFAASGSSWAKGLDERKVFHAALTAKGGDWRIGIGKGGQIYSLRGAFGEAVPPQEHVGSEWNDEVWQLVAVSSEYQQDAGQTHWRYYIHGSGTYRRDPDFDQTFYAPIVATCRDEASNSYAVMTWGQQAHVPTPFRSGVFYLTRFTPIDEQTVEVMYGVHNWGPDVLDFFNVPWGGVRATTFPLRRIDGPDGKPLEQSGRFPSPVRGRPLKDTAGWLLFAAADRADAAALGLVVGNQEAPWPGAQLLWRGGHAGKEPNPRDYAVTSVILKGRLSPGESFWRRCYFVMGSKEQVEARARDLVTGAKAERVQWSARNAPRDASGRWSVPVPGSQPLFEFRRDAQSDVELIRDPYLHAPATAAPNPLPVNHPRHGAYNEARLLRPYALKQAMWRLMGFVARDTSTDDRGRPLPPATAPAAIPRDHD